MNEERMAKIKAHNARVLLMKHWRRYDDCAACKAEPGKPCRNLDFKDDVIYRVDPHGVRGMVNG